MRILDFSGEIPKTKPQALPQNGASYAENVDLYGGLLRAHRVPLMVSSLVDEYGNIITDEANAQFFMRVGKRYVGFDRPLHWVKDPRESAGSDTVLFVRDGRLYRLSGRMIDNGIGAKPVGIEPPANPPTVVVNKGGGCEVSWEAQGCVTYEDCDQQADAPELRGYRITYVNECGEESAPSEVSALIDIYNGDGAIVVDGNTPPDNAVLRRYYRSATTTDGETVWLYVGEDVIADATFYDDVCAWALGEALTTEDHLPPSDCLDGVTLTRDLQTIVWSNNQFWVSEPRLPHAYKPETRVRVPYPIVFISSYTPTVEGDTHYDNVVATRPYLYAIDVRDDGQTNVKELQYTYEAVSPFGHTAYDGMTVYVSYAGLVGVRGTSVSLLTDELMTEREWGDFQLETMTLSSYHERVFAWYGRQQRSGLLFTLPIYDKRRPLTMSRLTLDVHNALTADDGMFMLMRNGIYKWGAGSQRMTYKWRSRIEVNSARWFPTVLKVVSDAMEYVGSNVQQIRREYSLWCNTRPQLDPMAFFEENPQYRAYMAQIINAVGVKVTLYCDGSVYTERAIRFLNPVSLPKRKRGIEWAIEITGKTEIREIHLQKSRNDLQNDGGHA